MNNEDFKYFSELAKTLNFNQAAKHLFITQPALSHRISKLEKELGNRLFIRSKHGVFLTDAGKVFLREFPKVQSAMQRMEKAIQNPADLNSPHSLYIGYQEGHILLPEFRESVNTFIKKRPDVQINMTSLSFGDLFTQLSSHSIDLAITYDFSANPYNQFSKKVLSIKQTCAAFSDDLPAALQSGQSDAEKIRLLDGQKLFLIDDRIVPGVTDFAGMQCEKCGIHPSGVVHMSSYPAILNQVFLGQGFTFSTADYAYHNFRLNFIPLADSIPLSITAYYNSIILNLKILSEMNFWKHSDCSGNFHTFPASAAESRISGLSVFFRNAYTSAFMGYDIFFIQCRRVHNDQHYFIYLIYHFIHNSCTFQAE